MIDPSVVIFRPQLVYPELRLERQSITLEQLEGILIQDSLNSSDLLIETELRAKILLGIRRELKQWT
jgi:hypothetical protein